MRTVPSLFLAATLLFAPSALVSEAVAKDVDLGKIQQSIEIFEALVHYPAPAWYRDGTMIPEEQVVNQSRYSRQQSAASFIQEQMPKDKAIDDWSQMFAIYGLRSTVQQPVSFDQFVKASLDVFLNACGKENFKLEVLHQDEIRAVTLIFCQNSPHGPDGSGYGEGIGEIGLFHFQRVGETFVKIYQEWRGERFDLANADSWPVTQQDIGIMVDRFTNIRMTPLPR